MRPSGAILAWPEVVILLNLYRWLHTTVLLSSLERLPLWNRAEKNSSTNNSIKFCLGRLEEEEENHWGKLVLMEYLIWFSSEMGAVTVLI